MKPIGVRDWDALFEKSEPGEIRALTTFYKGYRMRSRLEARWAIVFDTLKLKYEYEKQGFNLGKVGCYLPDFYLVKHEVWVEIKPPHEDPLNELTLELAKLEALCNQSHSNCLMLVGDPWPGAYDAILMRPGESLKVGKLAACITCGALYMQDYEQGLDWIFLVDYCDHFEQASPHTDHLKAAYKLAREARFEFGEKG